MSNIEWISQLDCLADIHVHLDGSLSVNAVKHLAQMQGIDAGSDKELSGRLSVSEDCRDLNEYLEKFEFPLSLLQTYEAIRYSVCELVREQEEGGVIYSEIRFAPQLHTNKGLSQKEVIEAACMGIEDSRKFWRAFSWHGLILCCMRGDGNASENMTTVNEAAAYIHDIHGQLGESAVMAIDLAGAEGLYPTEHFHEIFERAKEASVSYTIHAGEAAGAESVRAALDFGASRLGHGVRSIEEDALVDRLAKDRIVLEMCPTSNINTKVCGDLRGYPLKHFLDRGIRVTINTDNMTVSDTNEARELSLVADALGLSRSDVKRMIMNSIEAGFAAEAVKNRLRARVEARFAETAGIRG